MPGRILLAVADPARDDSLVRMAAHLASANAARLIVLHAIEISGEAEYGQSALAAMARRRQVESLLASVRDLLPDARALVRVGQDIYAEIAAAVREEACDLLLCGWGTPRGEDGEFGPVTAALLKSPPCDVAALHPPSRRVSRVLVPVRGGPYAELAVALGADLAGQMGADLTVLHIFRADVPERLRWLEEAPYLALMERLEAGRSVLKRVPVGTDVEGALLNEARGHDLLVMGAHGPATAAPVGINFARFRALTGCGAVVVKTRQPLTEWLETRPSWSPASVDKWFAENTFDAEEFSDLDRLLHLKERAGVTISLGLPALDEAETIGPLIECLRAALCHAVPLVDEIVVIDSGSRDGTAEIARKLGVPVYLHQEVLPGQGAHRGKGEALWKSLHVLRGDLIAWLDTDIRNPHPRLVYGLLGPLLTHPRIMYVKGYYSRPMKVGDTLYESGGGRVTELTARPLLNLFFPELSGFIQPLAGQFAGRREVLEQVPFFTGYGVEVGLLIDLLDRVGLPALAQVNLGRLVHRNSSLSHLSAMSFAILQVIVSRLEAWGRLQPLAPLHKTLKLIRWADGQLALDVRAVGDVERPPMSTVVS